MTKSELKVDSQAESGLVRKFEAAFGQRLAASKPEKGLEQVKSLPLWTPGSGQKRLAAVSPILAVQCRLAPGDVPLAGCPQK